MVTVNYQSFGTQGFQLRLRLYKSGETKFIGVTKLLQGAIQKKHWNQKKQRFIPSCPFSDENNKILVQFKQRYDEMAIGWTGSLDGLILAVENGNAPIHEGYLLHEYIQKIVDEKMQRKHEDGTIKGSYENYVKLSKRLGEYCKYKKVDYGKLCLSEVTPGFVNSVFDWVVNVRKGVGHLYISSMLHAVLMQAGKEGFVDWNNFVNCKWKSKGGGSAHKYNTLTSEQCSRFVSLRIDELPPSPKAELYRDFCTFILYTGQSACDAIALKYSDIKSIGGVDHFVFKRRKISEKQSVPCAVPINEVMKRIMDRWKNVAKDGYIFPIRNKKKLKEQTTNNGDIKHFVCSCNFWLKKVGKILGCNFPLHTYAFRHTAITHYLSKDVPIIYVANLMGTSVKNCEDIYYNNQGDVASMSKVLNALSF